METKNDTLLKATGLDALLDSDGPFSREALLSAPKRIKTGFSSMDRLLGGGLAPGLIILGGSPSLGKSTLALSMAKHIAADGIPVLYYSLEMPRERILAKLITSEAFCCKGPTFTSDDLFDPDKTKLWSDSDWEQFRQICSRVSDATHSLYVYDPQPGQKPLSALNIARSVKEFCRSHPEGPKPLVVVDYLQIIPPDQPGSANSLRMLVEESLNTLVELSRSEKLPVFLISSMGRANYKTPIQIDSFKETGSIEYSADVLMGIQFSACHGEGDSATERSWDLNAEKEREPRNVEVVVLKQRYGRTGTIPFRYFAKFDTFYEPDSMPGSSHETALAPSEAAAPVADRQQQSVPQSTVPDPAQTTTRPAVTQSPAQKPEPVKALSSGIQCYINNTLAAHHLQRGELSMHRVVLPKSGICSGYTVSDALSFSDCNIADTIYSLYRTGKYLSPSRSFRLRRVLTALTGDPSQTLTPQKEAILRTSLERLQQITITLDCQKELEERNRDWKYSDFDFNETHPFLTIHEKNGRFWFPSAELPQIMPLYAYAELTSQIISFPSSLMNWRVNGRKPLSDTVESVAIKRFLIYRLEVLRNGNSRLTGSGGMWTISFSFKQELMQALHIRAEDFSTTSQQNQKLRRIEKSVLEVLEHFRQIGYIERFKSSPMQNVKICGSITDPWYLASKPMR